MRIAIVGAGPAGLAAAVKLAERGYHDVKVFESSGRVGGKAMTLQIDGHYYDMGAVLVGNRYPHTMELASRYGVPMFPRSGNRAVVDLRTERWMNVIDAPTEVHSPREYLTALTQVHRYVRRYRRFFEQPGFAFTSFPDLEELRQEIALPLSEWARVKKVDPMLVLWQNALAGQGYGPCSSVSAQYALKFMLGCPRARLRPDLWRMVRKNPMPLFSFQQGYQALFEAVASSFDVTTAAKVTRIIRRQDGVIVYRAGHAEPERFDKVLIAMPLDTAAGLLEDQPAAGLAEETSQLFSRLEYTDYYATLAESSHVFEDAEIHFGHGVQKFDRPSTHASIQSSPDSKLRVFYHYGSQDEPFNADAAVEKLRSDLARAGISLGSLIHTQRWRYFPRFSPADVAAGCYDRAEELQGKLNTYYLGGALAFESIEHTIGYSYGIIEREFPAITRSTATLFGGATRDSHSDVRHQYVPLDTACGPRDSAI